MKPKILAIITVVIFLNTSCSKSSYKWVTTDRNEKILVGKIDRTQISNETFPWFKTNYEGYNSAQSTDVLYLKAFSNRLTFLVFAGTWCDDTHNLLPKFYRVLDEAQFPTSAVTLYAVDRNKKSLNGETDKNLIVNVPTIIVYKDGKEIGKIVETVQKSVEVDLKNMLLVLNN